MTHMYEHVGDVYFESTRKIGGYATLLQAINIDYNFVITLIMICTNYIFFFVVFLKQGWLYISLLVEFGKKSLLLSTSSSTH